MLPDSARGDTDVLEPETIIVPTLGMARWLKDRIALRDGVCANVQCAYVAEFLGLSLLRSCPTCRRARPSIPRSSPGACASASGPLPEIPEYRALTHSTEAKVDN